MRPVILFLTACFIVNSAYANLIDDLKTRSDVEYFVRKVNKILPDFSFNENIGKPDSCKTNYYKIDLDNNGLTDLVVATNFSCFAIIDSGNGEYGICHIEGYGGMLDEKYALKKIFKENNSTFLILERLFLQGFQPIIETRTDTLIFKFGGFVEYNSNQIMADVDEIHFESLGCWGGCPVFRLNIKSDKQAYYRTAISDDGDYRIDSFVTSIDAHSFNELMQIASYLRLMSLKDKYSVPWTDAATVTLEVSFVSGSNKTITDYGVAGTFGLQLLYKKLFALRESQKWQQ